LTVDAGVDNERPYRSSRPARRRITDGVCFRRFVSFRRSAASASKEKGLNFADKGLTKNFPMLGRGRAAMPGGSTL
jgi:hypothetical protein